MTVLSHSPFLETYLETISLVPVLKGKSVQATKQSKMRVICIQNIFLETNMSDAVQLPHLRMLRLHYVNSMN